MQPQHLKLYKQLYLRQPKQMDELRALGCTLKDVLFLMVQYHNAELTWSQCLLFGEACVIMGRMAYHVDGRDW
jgi:hypothetical protein